MTSKMAKAATLLGATNASMRTFLNSLLTNVRDELAASLSRDLSGPECRSSRTRIQRLFDYTMADGKFARSTLAMNTYMALQPSTSQQQLMNAGKIALTIEMLQTFFLIEDDIMDHGTRRRGKPCWHTLVGTHKRCRHYGCRHFGCVDILPGIGLTAINDGLLLDCGIDNIIRNSIPNHPRKYQILQSISEAKQKAVVGQMLDGDTKGIEDFTWQRYASIVEHKTSHYSYLLPLSIGLHLADFTAPNQLQFRHIAYRIGHLFQAQDDYLDCFGDPLVTGKSNLSDLAEGKCTWVTCALVEKLAKESPQKLQEFWAHFGQSDESTLRHAREIILAEGIAQMFDQYQMRQVEELRKELEEFPIPALQEVLLETLNAIVNRQK